MQKSMQKLGIWLCAALLALSLGGCAASEDASGYTDYNGVQIPNADIALMRNLYNDNGAPYPVSDEEILQSLAWEQVQLDEAERLGLMPSKAEAEAYHQEQIIKPTMQALASDDPMMHEAALYTLTLYQEERERMGITHDEFCDFFITRWQNMLGMNALYQHFLSEKGLTSDDMWASNLYSEYVEDLLAQAADSKEA